ncbi:hypothetical protein [Flammeovirga kamogawensis]|uniref:Outer membrane protein beta-barrel domain-containing protein n=1 Tax=Flammeovirga kamogawensis TaxID=373891 RepID=A0ABX8H1C6_9BACT|nr:hypothetical protein [Flammeovirga kamogawensis]MBB6459562.1 hypothetical protein [Flammeovirga kamogawensis]QWG09112.1 hypothetical protein KM029_09245 [Flammeovirga kamogawensis]TRX67400.1 hypothetical protein EO216_04285 [Flammeovirga kamogawensis]
MFNKGFTIKSISILGIMLISSLAFAQKPKYNKKSNNYSNSSAFYINTGVGFSGHGVPFYIGFDYNDVHPDISLGGSFGIRNWSRAHKDHYHDYRSWNISFNGNYHFNRIMNIPNNFDFYAGLNIGYYNYKEKDDHFHDEWAYYNSGMGIGLQIGGRWFITDVIGLNLQFGGGSQYTGGNFGVTFRL